MVKRFDVTAPRRQADPEGWRVSLKQLALLLLAGLAIIGAIYLIEGRGVTDLDSAGAGQALALEGALGPGPKVGETAPDFTLNDVDGQSVRLSDLRGRPVLLNFWATWCPPCRAEMPELDEVARERADTGLIVLPVNLQEEPAVVASYLRTLDVHFTSVLDRDGAVFRQYRISGLPTTVAIDRGGVVRAIHVGPLVKRGILNQVAKIS